jgi:hypothetical protein
MFDLVFPEVFCHKATKYSQEQHEKFPEIMGPFFAGSM